METFERSCRLVTSGSLCEMDILILLATLLMATISKTEGQFIAMNELAMDKLECQSDWVNKVDFNHIKRLAQYKGPNVCAVEEVIGSRKRYYSECMTYMPRRICEKPTFIRYHCCTGFESTGENDKGCSGITPVVDLMDTARNLYLREFRKHAKRGNLEEKLREEGAFTVFAPQNQAVRSAPSKVRDRMSKKNDQNLILYHMTNDRHYLHQLINNMELPSLYRDNPPLKVNRYSNGIVTVNCARIVLPNQVATNGILHVTEKVVEPVNEKGSLMEILLQEDRFGELVTALIVTQLGNILRDENRVFTLFAPTDEAFRKAPPDVLERILLNKDILEKLLKYHMLETSICSAAVIGPTQQRTLEGQKVKLTCDVNDSLRVNNISVSQADIVGTNGVIHVLDEILIPASANSLKEVMQELDMYEFLEYAQQAGTSDIINGKAEGNYTIFVPSQDAIRALTPQQRRTLQTTGAVRKVVRYHMTRGKITTRKIIGQETVTTESDNKEARLQISVHHWGFSVNGARIISSNHEAGNGVIHIIDKFLMPPEGTAIGRIKEDAQYSTFLSLLQTAKMDGLLLDKSGNYTIFAPTNDAFDAMDQNYLENVMSDPGQLSKFINYHILGQPVYTSALKTQWQYRFKSLTGDWVTIRKEEAEADIVGEGDEKTLTFVNRISQVMGEPIESINGVIYSLDEVLECPCIQETFANRNDIHF